MVGGDVKEVLRLRGRIWVNAEERDTGTECAIYVERNRTSEQIKPGDVIWWQGRQAMWTPKKNRDRPVDQLRQGWHFDIVILRIGYSGVAHPAKRLVDAAYSEESE